MVALQKQFEKGNHRVGSRFHRRTLLFYRCVPFVAFVLYAAGIYELTIGGPESMSSSNRLTSETPAAITTTTPATTTTNNKEFVVDILSIGTVTKQSLLDIQEREMSKHASVRYFYKAVEADDYEPTCSSALTNEKIQRIQHFCNLEVKHAFLWDIREQFFTLYENPTPGWVCAQKRPMSALMKLIAKMDGVFPDFLLIIDDDTYLRMDAVVRQLQTHDSEQPVAIAGRFLQFFVKAPIWHFVLRIVGLYGTTVIMPSLLSLPHGGYGSFYSRGTLVALHTPISCVHPMGRFDVESCASLQANRMGERALFKDGMTLLELMDAYVRDQPYLDALNWNNGVGACFHSDWIWGYFVEYYPIAIGPTGAGSFFSRTKWTQYESKIPLSECQGHTYSNYKFDFDICHFQTPESMQDLYDGKP
jgi:hypothetical protein